MRLNLYIIKTNNGIYYQKKNENIKKQNIKENHKCIILLENS